MRFFNRLTAILLSGLLLAPMAPLEAKTRKGDKYLAEGRLHETKKEWDAALELYGKALSEDPAEIIYQMAYQKAGFETSQLHLDKAMAIRAQGQLGEALIEFQKAYALNPGSIVAVQEIRETQQMIMRERRRVEETGKEAPPEQRALTPTDQARRDESDKIDRILPVPELKPLKPTLVDFKMNNQPVKIIFETIGRYAGINVLWDPDYTPPSKNQMNVDFDNSTVEQALDYVSAVTNSYWKAISANTIFITNNTQNKRRDYEEQVVKVFYLQNVTLAAEVQEIVNAVRTVPELNRVFPDTNLNAIVVRGEADRVELAGKIVQDLDKARPEVLIDILVLEANSVFSRQITAAIAAGGLNLPGLFSPRSGLQVVANPTTTNTTASTSTTPTATSSVSTTSTSTVQGLQVPLSNLSRISSADFSTTLPNALLQAVMSDAKTRVVQAPQLRAMNNIKSTMNIGERIPSATGSFQAAVATVGVPSVQTQFQYIDVGVKVEITPQVHPNDEISLDVNLGITGETGTVNLSGIPQPIISQRTVTMNMQMREGEVALLGGLINQQDDKTVSGIPGLSSIPILGRLFKGEAIDHNRDELMMVLIPHILRRTEFTPENLRAVATGSQLITLHHGPKPAEPTPAKPVAPNSAAPAPPGAPAVPLPGPTTAPALTPNPTAPGATAPVPLMPPATAPPLPSEQLPPPTSARVRFSSGPVDANLSSSFTVSVVLENGTDVASAPMQIQFDPKLLRLNNVTQGDFLASGGAQPVINILNDTGQATIQLNRAPGSAGVNGGGTLVNLNFQAVGRGSTVVTAPNMTVRNSQGQTIATGTPQLTVNIK